MVYTEETDCKNGLNKQRRFLVRFYDTKKLYSKISTFNNSRSAIMFMQSLKFIRSELEVYDSITNKIIKEPKKVVFKS